MQVVREAEKWKTDEWNAISAAREHRPYVLLDYLVELPREDWYRIDRAAGRPGCGRPLDRRAGDGKACYLDQPIGTDLDLDLLRLEVLLAVTAGKEDELLVGAGTER